MDIGGANSAAIEFSTLMNKYLDEDLKPDVEKLLKAKIQTPEINEGKRIESINRYLDFNIKEIEKIITMLPAEKSNSWKDLNRIFLSLLEK